LLSRFAINLSLLVSLSSDLLRCRIDDYRLRSGRR